MTGIVLCFWAMLVLSRGTPFGVALNRWMVEWPAAWLSRVRRTHLVVAATVAGLAGVLAWMGGEDAVRMVGMALPDAAAWLATLELSSLADIVVVAATAWSAVRFGSVRRLLGVTRRPNVPRRPGHGRARRKATSPRGPANDDDGSTVFASAA